MQLACSIQTGMLWELWEPLLKLPLSARVGNMRVTVAQEALRNSPLEGKTHEGRKKLWGSVGGC